MAVSKSALEPARQQHLKELAYKLRQLAISRRGDLAGWKIARLLREAKTSDQADEAERQSAAWGAACQTRVHGSR
jgi:hypothetical protein